MSVNVPFNCHPDYFWSTCSCKTVVQFVTTVREALLACREHPTKHHRTKPMINYSLTN